MSQIASEPAAEQPAAPPKDEPLRSIIYIDGFNLYHGLEGILSKGPHKWLDVELFCKRLRQQDSIQKICFFTSMVPATKKSHVRQRAYLDAIQTRPLVEVILGKFEDRERECYVRNCSFGGSRFFRHLQEKRTDVNIAVRMMEDAHLDRTDVFVVISGDSDLLPALHSIRTNFPKKKRIVYVPTKEPKLYNFSELSRAATSSALPLNDFHNAQLPLEVALKSGATVRKPIEWRTL